jgi:hypothetical protein
MRIEKLYDKNVATSGDRWKNNLGWGETSSRGAHSVNAPFTLQVFRLKTQPKLERYMQAYRLTSILLSYSG